jgi:adenosylmethionine-8-amino-7-oxononanoate aminotransferase
VFSAVFEPLCFPVIRTPGYADPGWADKACAAVAAHAGELAAVVMEPLVQGASGMLCATPDDVRRVGEACRDAGTLLICDEVATGFGRTGTLFASEQCAIRPDLLCLGKGITGGYLAMSATVTSDEVHRAFLGEDLGPLTLYHGHSYGGNALAAAVALEHIRLVESWDVLSNVRARAEQLSALLAERITPRPAVREVRQRGLMVGVELAPPGPGLRWGRRVCAGAVSRGVLLRPLGDVVVLMPPLTVSEDEIARIVDALDGAIDAVPGGAGASLPS